MSTDKLRVESNERVDIQDFQFLTKESVESSHRQLLSQFMTGPDKNRKWVLDGFEMSNPSAKQLRVEQGRAIAALREGGSIYYGLLLTEGDGYKIVDLNTYGAGTYGIYVRFEFAEGDSESRIFWNPAGAGNEYTQTIPTRYLANWSVRVEASNPGSEWMQIGTVDQATMAITDQRQMYFEGGVHDSYASGWSSDGGGNIDDRDSDRQLHGVKDFQTFTSAMRQCLEDIKGRGLRRWWERDIGGMNIGFDGNPTEDRLAIGDSGHYLEKTGGVARWHWDVDDEMNFSSYELKFKIAGSDRCAATAYGFECLSGSYDLGTTTNPWRDLWMSRDAHLGGGITVGDSILPDTAFSVDIASSALPFQSIYGERIWVWADAADSGNTGLFLYNPLGTVDLRNWIWQPKDSGDLTLSPATDAGAPLAVTQGSLEFLRYAYNPWQFYYINFHGTNPRFTLHHEGVERMGFSMGSDGMTFIKMTDDGSTTQNLWKLRYDSGEGDYQLTCIQGALVPHTTYPALNDFYDLGRSGERWAKTWTVDADVSGVLTVATGASKGCDTLEPYSSTSPYTLGTTTYPWYAVYADRLFLGEGVDEGVQGDLLPANDDDASHYIGKADRRWYWIYAHSMRLHPSTLTDPEIQLGTGTATDRNWKITGGTKFGISAVDENFANPVLAWGIQRGTGTALLGIDFHTHIRASAAYSWDIGNTSYPFNELWVGEVNIKNTVCELRFTDTDLPAYWKLQVDGNSYQLVRTDSSFSSPQVLLGFSMTDEDTPDTADLHGKLQLWQQSTYMNPSQDHTVAIVGPAKAPTVQRGWLKVRIHSSSVDTYCAIPYVYWTDIN